LDDLTSDIVCLFLLVVIAFASWVGIFGVIAAGVMRKLMRGRKARKQDRVMMEVMTRKIAATEESAKSAVTFSSLFLSCLFYLP